MDPDQEQLLSEIEGLFGKVDVTSLRVMTRQLEKLVGQVTDPLARRRYEAAIDALPDMLSHLNEGQSWQKPKGRGETF